MAQRLDWFRAAPQGAGTLIAVEKYLENCGLEHKLLLLVKVRVSQMNGCAYCLHMHTADAREAGESERRLYLLNAWRESALYSDRERAALAWAEALTEIAESHAPDDVFRFARSQFSERELTDLSIAIAMINLWNRLAIAVRAEHPNEHAAAA
jgi:AhpD family alkylhydroperoxidase